MKIRNILIIGSYLFAMCSAYSQSNIFSSTIAMELNNVRDNLSSSEKKDLVQRISDKTFKEEIVSQLGDDLSNFYALDIDGDLDLDLIYYGFAGSESNRTLIFSQKNGKLENEFDRFGEMKMINLNPITGLASFVIHEYPCCDENVYSLEYYTVSTNQGDIDFSLRKKLNYVRGLFFPEKMDLRIPFKINRETYNLRNTPEIDDDNIIATYPNGVTGVAISTLEKEDGRIWWLVVINNNMKAIDSSISATNNPGSYHSIGWMSSRYLEEL